MLLSGRSGKMSEKKSSKPSEKKSFEEMLSGLEKTAEILSSEDITLEEAVAAYEKGIREYEACRNMLDSAKQKIEVYRKGEEND